MGCDIHLNFERYNTELSEWEGVSSDFWPGRNYRSFACLASGIRGYGGYFDARGFPADASALSFLEYTLQPVHPSIAKALDGIEDAWWAHDRMATTESVARWGTSTRPLTMFGETRTVHPEWHTPSYLSFAEVDEVAQENDFVAQIRDHMKQNNIGRIVFWFDN